MELISLSPIPAAERSKARICGRCLAGITGSISAGGMDVCVVGCTVQTKRQARKIKKKKQVQKKYREEEKFFRK
jgi:hypothetical protein